MFRQIKNLIKVARYKVFPVATISEALGVPIVSNSLMTNKIQGWMRNFKAQEGLGLCASIPSELARLATIESKITITSPQHSKYLSEQMTPVLKQLRGQAELGLACGGLVFKPYVDGENISVCYISAEDFYPTSFSGKGEMTGVVFVEELYENDKIYRRLEYHHIEENGCVIENKAFVTTLTTGATVLGQPVSLDAVDEWKTLEPIAKIENVNQLLIGYFKPPMANNIDTKSPLGISCFSRALPLITQVNEQWQRILWEYSGTELAVHADNTLFQKDVNGCVCLPEGKERLYRMVRGDFSEKEKIKVFSPIIRDEPLFNGLNNMLKRVEFQCSLAYGTLSDPQNTDKTAEEIKASKQRSYALVKDIQKSLQTAIDGLVYAMDIWASLSKLTTLGAYKVTYEWDDSIVSDPNERKKLYWQYVQAGKFPFWRYLVMFENHSEQEAKEIVAEAKNNMGEPYATG